MNTKTGSWLSRNKWILALIGVPVLAGAWWAFRPEKLFINQKVNEAAPAALSSEPEALYTGKLEGKIHPTSGRATIYKAADGKQYLRLSDFSTSNGPDVHVLLVRAEDKALDQEIVTGDRGLESVSSGSDLLRKISRDFWRSKAGEVLRRKICETQRAAFQRGANG